jgi:Tol biopolymer transport system component
MRFPTSAVLLPLGLLLAGCVPDHPLVASASQAPSALAITAGKPFDGNDPREVHLRNVRQLTFDGENAEAYWDFQGRRLSYQRTGPDGGCDQIYTIDLASGRTVRVSDGTGRTTCSYYYPGGDRVLYATTTLADPACPPRPDFSKGYVWAVYPTFDIVVADTTGKIVQRLTDTPGYDAEATISPKGDRMVFTSERDGDLDIYTMNLDGSDVRRITNRLGYDGGAFFSPDGSKIVWRANYPETPKDQADYRQLLAEHLIRPTTLELWVANADGSDAHQVTHIGAASFAPFFDPSGQKIVFSSNMDDPAGRDFDIYRVNLDGSGLERITYAAGFDGFPMFSPDGKYLAFGSNRNPSHEGNTNVFVAEWVETPAAGAAPASATPNAPGRP